jgi:hypothetical protein
VFCWKEDGGYLFAEAKRYKYNKIRASQRKWLEAALQQGLPLTSFLLVEWTLSARAVQDNGSERCRRGEASPI